MCICEGIMNPRNILLIGGNRGIGLQLVKDLLQLKPNKLLVTCRQPGAAAELQELSQANSNIVILELDVAKVLKEDKVPQFVSEVESALEGEGLNLFINNAGVLIREHIDLPTLTDVFTVNAFAPLILTKALIPLLKKAAQGSGDQSGLRLSRAGVVNITSKVGSIEDNKKGGNYLYRGSKIALNMFTKNLSIEYGPDGILFLLLHPGWVKTDMGGPNALISTEESVQGMMQVMEKCTEVDQCKFYDFAGKEHPW